ncbi:hypothetical protein [Isoalcanivorax indicus]|uniref:hypothetical protein n=1 Tax=Isoalcanivorax indicus TaxID=2202653 RepID=UPI000DB9D0E4|nr:hypothetical protein [Isoalcanivorax indicus]
MRNRIVHLGIGALLVLGYFAGLPGFLWTPGSGLAIAPVMVTGDAETPPALPPQTGQHAAWVTADDGITLLWARGDGLYAARWAPGEAAWSPPEPWLDAGLAGEGWLDGGFVPQRLADDSLAIHFIQPGPFPALARLERGGDGHWRRHRAGQVLPLPGGEPTLRAPGLPLRDGGLWMTVQVGDRESLYAVSADGRLQGRQFLSAPGEQISLLAESEAELLALLAPAQPGLARWRASADLGHRWTLAAPLQALAEVAPVPLAAVRLDARDWGLVRSDPSGQLFWHRSRDGGQQWLAPQALVRSSVACLQQQPPALHGGRDGLLHLVYPQHDGTREGDCRLHYLPFRVDGRVLNRESNHE